ncbi:NUT family member 2E [Plecturocebus cupreus]
MPKGEEAWVEGHKSRSVDKEWKSRGHQVEALCCKSEGQFKSCLNRHTPSVLLPSNWKWTSVLDYWLEPFTEWPPPLPCPSPSAECLGSYVLNLFVFKFYWIYLNSGESVEAGHSLGPVLDFSYHGNCQTAVISTQPKGMASNEGESIGTGALSNSLPCFKSLGIQI